MKHRNLKRSLLTLAAATLVAGSPAHAAENDVEWENDFNYLVRLGQENLPMYADMQLKEMARLYPDRANDMKLARGIYYFAINKVAEAEKELGGIPKGTPLYTRMLFVKGTNYARKGRNAEAEKAFREYLQLVPKCPSKKREKAEFIELLGYYDYILKALGKGAEAAKLIEKMPAEDLDARQIDFLKQRSVVDAEENKINNHQQVNFGALDGAIKGLKALQFERDGIAALAPIQIARAQALKGYSSILAAHGDKGKIKAIPHFLAAIKTIQGVEDFIAEIDRVNPNTPPLAPDMLFIKAFAIRGQAEVTACKGDVKLAGKQLQKGSVGLFKLIQAKYKNADVAKKLQKQFALCEDLNSKYGLGLKLDIPKVSKTSDLAAQFEPGDIQLNDKKNYAEAAKLYKAAIDKNIKNPAVLENLRNYCQCLAMLDRYDEGKAFIETLQKAFPNEKAGVGQAAFVFGAWVDKRSKETAKGGANPHAAKQAEIVNWAWNLFVDWDKGNPNAPLVADSLAQQKLNVVARLGKELSTAKDKAAVNAKLEQAFKDCIPLYQRLADVFPMHEKGRRANFRLGLIYKSLHENDTAIGYYNQFIANDDGTLEPADILEAVFNIGSINLTLNRPEDAIAAFNKTKEMTEPGQRCADAPKAALIRELAFALIPDCIDASSNLLTSRIAGLEETAAKLSSDIYGLDLQIRSLDKDLKAIPAAQKEAEAQLEETRKLLSSFELDYKTKAAEQAKTEAAKPGAPKTEKEFFDIFLKGIEDNAKTAVTTETEAVETSRAAVEKQTQELKARHADIERNLKALEKGNDDQKAAIEKLQAAIKATQDSFAKAEKDVKDAEEAREAFEKTVQTSTDDDEIKKAKEGIRLKDDEISKLKLVRLNVITNAAKNSIIANEREIRKREGAIADNSWNIKTLQQEDAIIADKLAAAAITAETLTVRQNFIDVATEAIGKNEEGRLKAAPAVKQKANEAIAAMEKSVADELKTLTTITTRITEARQNCEKRKAELAKTQAATEAEKEPLIKESADKKRLAIEGYREYLRLYPNGKSYSSSTANLANVLVDIEKYDEAVSQLNNLLTKVPECNDTNPACDPAKAADTLYKLARAQTKAKRGTEAQGTYNRLMKNSNERVRAEVDKLPLGNLFFIAEQGMSVNAHEAALAACETILKRVAASNGQTDKLRPAQVEKVYIEAAKAALASKDDVKTQKMINELLTKNPRTSYLYDARFIEAEALAVKGDIPAGVTLLNQMLRKINDTPVANRIRCKIAQIYLMSTDKENREKALGVYESIVEFAQENVELDANWLQSEEARLNQENVDTAFIEAARLYRNGNNDAKLQKLKDSYRSLYPNNSRTISTLGSI